MGLSVRIETQGRLIGESTDGGDVRSGGVFVGLDCSSDQTAPVFFPC